MGFFEPSHTVTAFFAESPKPQANDPMFVGETICITHQRNASALVKSRVFMVYKSSLMLKNHQFYGLEIQFYGFEIQFYGLEIQLYRVFYMVLEIQISSSIIFNPHFISAKWAGAGSWPEIRPGILEESCVYLQPVSLLYKHIQCGAPKIAKLVYNSNNYGLRYLQL